MAKLPIEIEAAAMRALMVPEHQTFDSVAQAIMAERERIAAFVDRFDTVDGHLLADKIRDRRRG